MHPLAGQIRRFIERGEEDEAAFQMLSLALFARQFEENAPYRAYCRTLGAVPGAVNRWRDIPAAPAEAFKRFDLACAPAESARALFYSSGTTGTQASRHYMDEDALSLYETSLAQAFDRFALPDRAQVPLWSLIAPPEEAPHSSLSYMVGVLMRRSPGLPHRFFWQEDRLQLTAFKEALLTVREPVILFGTAFAFMHFLESSRRQFPLPEGSRLLETGGFKGRSREVSRKELYHELREQFSLHPARILAEYGMSEMASQFYDTTLQDALRGICRPPFKAGPPWVKTLVIDPASGREAAAGETGLLRHFDLANFNSVAAIQTEDMGRAAGEGFELLGRAPSAPARGCSLTAEEWLRRD
ncbi:MAG: long-chain fatty acid--CoA ligase [Armatimonadetes bacterium]|nr:long-chain fatty acid--CoA ligase [Armatimonadota bacterium]